MSEWIDSEIKRLEETYERFGGGSVRHEKLEMLRAMKLAEEALRTCGYKYDLRVGYDADYTVQVFDDKKLHEALAAIDALGKQDG